MDLKGKALVSYGTSRTKGQVDASIRWTKLLADEGNGIELNFGVNGGTLLSGGVQFFKEDIIQFNPASHELMTIEYATNELRISGGNGVVIQFKQVLSDFVDFAINNRGWSPNRIILQSVYYPQCANKDQLPSYEAAYLEIVNTRGLIFADYYNYFKDNPLLTTYFFNDGIHENELGNRKVADFYKALDLTGGNPPVDPPVVGTVQVFSGHKFVLNAV